jgi:hypothetical protein
MAHANDFSCANPDMLRLADATYKMNLTLMGKIPGVVKVEVGDCSEIESPAVTADMGFVCGIFLWFDNSEAESIFKATTKIWGSTLGSGIPTCSRTVSRVR